MSNEITNLTEESEEISVKDMKNILLYALPKLKQHTNEWSVRDTLIKFTKWGFWNKGEFCSIDIETANDIVDALTEFVEDDFGNNNVEEVFEKLEHYIMVFNLYTEEFKNVFC